MHFCMIVSKKWFNAMRSVQSMFFNTENFSIKTWENNEDMESGNVICMCAIVSAMCLMIKSL